MQSTPRETSAREVVGVTSGALALSAFSILWAGFALQGLNAWSWWMVLILTAGATVALLAFGLTTLRAARRLPQTQETAEDQARGKRLSRGFNIVSGLEFTLIAVAVVLLISFKHPEFIAPVTALIVGLHFLPLAYLFEVRVYALVGALLALLGGGALLALLLGLTLGSLTTWSVIIGLSTAGIFWLTALSLLTGVRRALSRSS